MPRIPLVQLIVKEIKDKYAQENFKNLANFFINSDILNVRFQHVEQTFSTNGTFDISHTLGAVPKDLIETSKTGTGTITYNYSDFTDRLLKVTVSGTNTSDPLKVRLLVGNYNRTG